METKDIATNIGTVKIWKMNYGFRSDLDGEIASIEETREGERARVNIKEMKIKWLVYGIYESEPLKIRAPLDINAGLSPQEIDQRVKMIRGMEDAEDGSLLYSEIITFNRGKTDKEKDEIKK